MATTSLNITDALSLPNSVGIPRLGFGVYMSPPTKCTDSCLAALKAGYRHIDTAQYYGNEREVGKAIRRLGLRRSAVFITSKILEPKGSIDDSYESLLESVKAIDGEDGSVDLFLIHAASTGMEARKELWLALERLYSAGKTKSIGVSNFGVGHIEEMKEFATIWPPHVNQLELHPWCQQREVVQYCRKKNMTIEAYCPLVRNEKADDPTLKVIAAKHHVSTAQVLIRWSLQKDWVPLPKSDTASRILANADVYGFHLSGEDMRQLDQLDQGAEGSICFAVNNTL